jgi:hypothetical protein
MSGSQTARYAEPQDGAGRYETSDPSTLTRRRVALCRDAGKHIGAASPNLQALATRFDALSETLDTGDMFAASWNLELVAQDIRAMGVSLVGENQCLHELIALNLILSRRIGDVSDDVRLLVAMVSNAKVEMASIDAPGESLEGFGQTLESLAAKAKGTLQEYQATHTLLLAELHKTAKAHGTFADSHQDKLGAVSVDIDASVATFRSRHKIIAGAAADIAKAARLVGTQLTMCADGLLAQDGTDVPRDAAAQLARLGEKVDDLASPSNPLVMSRGEVAASFLGELEPKLKTTEALIHECRQSRVAVDTTAVSVVSTFEELEGLAAQVAAMVIDMTIIGTNAIVKSFRLGQRGAGLSIIAQHLRSLSLKVAEGITLLTPAMADARRAATTFTTALESQDAARMAALAARAADVVDSFARVGTQTKQAMQTLTTEVLGIGTLLRRTAATLETSIARDEASADADATDEAFA